MYVAYSSVKSHQNDIFILYELPLKQAIVLIGDIIINTGLKISIVYMIVGIADFAYNKHKFNNDMKMTKQEVKDEFKIQREIRPLRVSSVNVCRRLHSEG